jgi:predicted alpha/beta-fold hydrolase
LNTSFYPPFWQFNGHIQTIVPSLFRKVPVSYQRERLELPDGDFLDLDWHKNGSRKLVIVTHGLEGDSTRHYVTGIISALAATGYDGLGWNSRSCSGELNRLPRFYHHGDAEDLRYVLEYAVAEHRYEEIILAGFSMGGSLTLRLLGDRPELLPKEVQLAVVASVPLDLKNSVDELCKPGRRFYMNRFIQKLGKKIEVKSKLFPDNPHLKFDGYYDRVKDFIDFDNLYTAPLHGYDNALDFYAKASAKPLLKNIRVNTTIVQAMNDPFLGEKCYDTGDTENQKIKLLITKRGGHVGFMQHSGIYSFVEQLAVHLASEK